MSLIAIQTQGSALLCPHCLRGVDTKHEHYEILVNNRKVFFHAKCWKELDGH